MKLFGAALLTAAGLLGGALASRRMYARLRLCRELCRMLRLIGFHLDCFLTPLPELFSELAAELPGGAGTLCRRAASEMNAPEGRFSDIWISALEDLPAREREILEPLGPVLGRYGAAEQTAAVSAALAEMTALCGALETDVREKSRVCVGLFMAGGLMLAVLLM